jgi:hypothetical protein
MEVTTSSRCLRLSFRPAQTTKQVQIRLLTPLTDMTALSYVVVSREAATSGSRN